MYVYAALVRKFWTCVSPVALWADVSTRAAGSEEARLAREDLDGGLDGFFELLLEVMLALEELDELVLEGGHCGRDTCELRWCGIPVILIRCPRRCVMMGGGCERVKRKRFHGMCKSGAVS
jgi:hypothetical protein